MEFVKDILEVGTVDDIFVTDLAKVEVIGGDTIRYTLTARQDGRNIVRARLIWSFARRLEVEHVFKRAAEEIHAHISTEIRRVGGSH